MARLPPPPPAVCSGAALILLFVLVAPCHAMVAGGGKRSAVVLPVRKVDEKQQYVATFRQGTPQVPANAVLDLAGATLWVDCDAGRVSSSKARVPCTSKSCKKRSCPTSCTGKGKLPSNCYPCIGSVENTVTGVVTDGQIFTDVLSLPNTFPVQWSLATAPAFLFTCGRTSLTESLAAGSTGMVSLSRAPFALPTQLAGTFGFSRKFALCLPRKSEAGVVIFGEAPYSFSPLVYLSKSLNYTPLLVNPVSTTGVSTKRDRSTEYFIGVKGIKVNGRTVPLNAKLLAINNKGVGGTKLSMVSRYTVLQTSIHKAVTDAFAAEMTMTPRVQAVAPFKLCYNASKVRSTRWEGPAVPTVELVLQSAETTWKVSGWNLMVGVTARDAVCLGVVDGGKTPETSVVIGGHMMEEILLEFDLETSQLGFSSSLGFRKTTCSNFLLG